MTVLELDPSHIPFIVSLRQQEYSKLFGDQFHPQKFEWNDVDAESKHLGVFKDNQLISILRMTTLNENNFEKVMAAPLDKIQFQGSLVAFSRAATESAWHGKGLHLLLRYHGLLIARAQGVHWVFGTMEKSASRIPLMKSMGYEFTPNKKGWSGWAQNKEEVLIAHLDLKTKGPQALDVLHSLLKSKNLL